MQNSSFGTHFEICLYDLICTHLGNMYFNTFTTSGSIAKWLDIWNICRRKYETKTIELLADMFGLGSCVGSVLYSAAYCVSDLWWPTYGDATFEDQYLNDSLTM